MMLCFSLFIWHGHNSNFDAVTYSHAQVPDKTYFLKQDAKLLVSFFFTFIL